jgi:hypothetical protein
VHLRTVVTYYYPYTDPQHPTVWVADLRILASSQTRYESLIPLCRRKSPSGEDVASTLGVPHKLDNLGLLGLADT